jgi:hypothetical protein
MHNLKILNIGKMMPMISENKMVHYYPYGNFLTIERKNYQYAESHGIQDILIYLQLLMGHVYNYLKESLYKVLLI